MASPGLISTAIQAHKIHAESFVATIGLHLGSKRQHVAVAEGYDQAEEDRPLAKIDWPRDGHRLFEISCFAGSSTFGWFGPINESNAPVRKLLHRLGAMERRMFVFHGVKTVLMEIKI